jgi:hypothetical protein
MRLSLIFEARGYIKERLPVHDRATAVRHLAAAGCTVEGMNLVEETLASRKALAEANGK